MNANLKTFPKDRNEALTMLYLESQNIEILTPEELAKLYTQTLTKIEKGFIDQRNIRDKRNLRNNRDR